MKRAFCPSACGTPGGDMTKGFTQSVPRYQQPLTLMAQQATKGKSGLNVEGYRGLSGCAGIRRLVMG